MTVHLVGAGPGNPDLLTVRGARLLSAADVVVHDRVTTARILDLVPADAVRIDVGRAPGSSPAGRLINGGLSPSTPVAAVRWATTADQQVVRTTLADVARQPLAAPTIIVIGAVAGLDLRPGLATSFA